jgi:hypothetical protein
MNTPYNEYLHTDKLCTDFYWNAAIRTRNTRKSNKHVPERTTISWFRSQ